MIFSRALFIVCTLAVLTAATFAGKQKAETAALIEHARQLSDIRTEGAPPFRLKMDFRIMKDDGAVLNGTYTELWISETQIRAVGNRSMGRRGRKSYGTFCMPLALIPGLSGRDLFSRSPGSLHEREYHLGIGVSRHFGGHQSRRSPSRRLIDSTA